MAKKVTFSARKDPLLRPRRPASEHSQDTSVAPDAPAAGDDTTPSRRPARKRTAAPTPSARQTLAAVEEPVGVIAVPTASADRDARVSAAQDDSSTRSSEPAPASERSARVRHRVRRVQTSVSLPPATWERLDELGEAAGVSAGELLVAILAAVTPETPTAAVEALEQLLVTSLPHEGPHEERNYRLPLDLRAQLDALTEALGPSVQRSLLIRALLAAHAPHSSDDARALITARRLEAMRAAMRASAG